MTTARARKEQTAPDDWHSLPAEEAIARLGATLTGLSAEEVRRRQKESGPNRVTARRGTPAWLNEGWIVRSAFAEARGRLSLSLIG